MQHEPPSVRNFTNVDAGGQSSELIAYLDEATKLAAEGKRQSYALLQLQPGMSVLDVGCGTGDDVRALAGIVGESGRAAGIDASQAMIEEALSRGIPPNVEFRQASATEIPFDDASFDAARAERVFQHLEQPDAAAREIHRVLKPGGLAMLLDQDWETLIVAGSKNRLTRAICNAFADHPANGWAGRNHPGLLKRAGFRDVTALPFSIALPFPPAAGLILKNAAYYATETGAVSAHDAAQWLADLHMADERGEFFCAFTLFAVTGRR